MKKGKHDLIITPEDFKDCSIVVPAKVAEEHLIVFNTKEEKPCLKIINWKMDMCSIYPGDYEWICSGVDGNPFRAAFAINLFLWSLGIFEGWCE